VLAKRGQVSRSEAERLVRAGRVSVNGCIVRCPLQAVVAAADDIRIDGVAAEPVAPCYLMLNKPRGLVTTRADEQGRATVFRCLEGAGLPRLSPVGRLDKASEGLLLFSNDSDWAHRLTDPARHVPRHYHVQVAGIPTPATLAAMQAGVVDPVVGRHAGDAAGLLRTGSRNAWLALSLEAGRNRHLRRLLGALGLEVLRLVRVGIGELGLGDLPKGAWRQLGPTDFAALGVSPRAGPGAGAD
jgi:23S rRNA pseudouridine2605 synthase